MKWYKIPDWIARRRFKVLQAELEIEQPFNRIMQVEAKGAVPRWNDAIVQFY
jgi:hypothetical protein